MGIIIELHVMSMVSVPNLWNQVKRGEQIKTVALQQIGFWMGVSLAGGVLAEVAAKTY